VELQKQLDAEQITQEQFERERKAISKEAAQNQKEVATFDAIIANAANVVKALGQGPPVPNIPLAAFTASLGLLEIAAIRAQPIPAFATGTFAAPEGVAKVGEAGAEFVFLPQNAQVATNARSRQYGDEFTAMQRGTFDQLVNEKYILPALAGMGTGEVYSDKNMLKAMRVNKNDARANALFLANTFKSTTKETARHDRRMW